MYLSSTKLLEWTQTHTHTQSHGIFERLWELALELNNQSNIYLIPTAFLGKTNHTNGQNSLEKKKSDFFLSECNFPK